MDRPYQRFRLPAKLSGRALLSLVAKECVLRVAPPLSSERSWLDSADWRVFKAGLCVVVERDLRPRGSVELAIWTPQEERLLGKVRVGRAPEFAPELPAGGLWAQVAQALGTRRLLVMASAQKRTVSAEVLDDQEKVVARLEVQRYLLPTADGRLRVLRLATVCPLRGYGDHAQRLCRLCERAGLRAENESVLAVALRTLRRAQPGSNPGAMPELDPSQRCDEALAAILAAQLEALRANTEGTCARLDSEFLHEYRVALRRARSVLKRTPGVIDPAVAADLSRELRWLAGLTSPVRDCDVYLEQLGPSRCDDDPLDPLRQLLGERQRRHQEVLVEAIHSSRYKRLVELWESAVRTHPSPSTEAAPLAGAPVGAAAAHFVSKAWRRVLRDGRAVRDDSPAEALHELRKRAKELRYLIEAFSSLFPEKTRGSFLKQLKALQDNLGEHQDSQVQAQALEEMAEELASRPGVPAAALMAMGALAEDLRARQRAARAEFAKRFARFDSKSTRQSMQQMLLASRAGVAR
jgi:CHAD domain-containing protein